VEIPAGAYDSTLRVTIGPGQTMPAFALPDAAGEIVRLKSFKQRRPVLLALLHGSSCPQCRDWLATLAHVQGELADLRVQPLLVVPDDVEQLPALQADTNAPGVLLADPAGELGARFLSGSAPSPRAPVMLIAVDQYSTCLEAWVTDEPGHLPALDDVLATFAFAEQEDCACGLPAWPVELNSR
jgi:peroxiredoxin